MEAQCVAVDILAVIMETRLIQTGKRFDSRIDSLGITVKSYSFITGTLTVSFGTESFLFNCR